MEVPSDDENGNGVTVTSTIVTGTSQGSRIPFLRDELRKSQAPVNLLPGEVVTNITPSTSAHERLFPGFKESGILSVPWAPRKDPKLLEDASGPTEESTTASAAPTAVNRLHEAMAGTKGQSHLIEKLEMMVKAATKAKKRREKVVATAKAAGTAPPPPDNLNMIFGGPPGAGKTTSVRKMGPILHELGVLENPNVVVVDKETGLPKPPKNKSATVAECVSFMFQEADGGILFLDEIHQRTQKEFVQPLLAALVKYEGRVMVIIAGYTTAVDKWLKEGSDPGMSSRFPQPGRIEFVKLTVPTLVKIAISKLGEQDFSLADSAASDALHACMQVVHDTDPPTNGRGARDYAAEMIQRHDANASYDDDDTRITTADIFAACPEARGSCAAETEASPSGVVAGDAGPSETGGGVQAEASSSAVVAVDDSEDDVPLTSRGKQSVTSGGTGSSRKRKEREPSSVVADATDTVQANPLLETALRILYPTPEGAIHAHRLEIFKELSESDDVDVRKGWKSLGDREARAQVLDPKRSNKAANEMLHAAMLAVHGLDFGNYKASAKGEQGGMMVLDKNGSFPS